MKINNLSQNLIQLKNSNYKENKTSFKAAEEIAADGDILDLSLSEEIVKKGSVLSDLWENKLGPVIDRWGKFIVEVVPDYTIFLMVAGLVTGFSMDQPANSSNNSRRR